MSTAVECVVGAGPGTVSDQSDFCLIFMKLKKERFQSARSNRTTDGDVSGTCFVWQETYKSKDTNLIEFQNLARSCDLNDPRKR